MSTSCNSRGFRKHKYKFHVIIFIVRIISNHATTKNKLIQFLFSVWSPDRVANTKGLELLYLVHGRHSSVSLELNSIFNAWNHRGDHEYNKETKCKPFFSDVVETQSIVLRDNQTSFFVHALFVSKLFPLAALASLLCLPSSILPVTQSLYLIFILIFTEAVARQSIPVHHATKAVEKGEKKSSIKYPQKVHIRSEAPYPHTKTFFEGPGLDESEMEVIGHVTKKKKRSESTKKRKKRKRHINEEKTAGQ